MTTTNKIWNFFDTDFYQITMGFSYVISGKNQEKTGFEGFVRNIKPIINPNEDFYIFDGENEVHEFMKKIKEELNNPEISNKFIELVESKITSKNKEELIKKFRENWESIDTDFEYNVISNGTIVKDFVPVFQFYGDKMIGQMIETPITNIYNGKTGLKTLKYLSNKGLIKIPSSELKYLEGIMDSNVEDIKQYKKELKEKAKEFRDSTTDILLEAAFRRSPSFHTALIATEVAIEEGWNGTSNVAAYQRKIIKKDKIGGSMAHAFVMSYNTEKQAIIDYDKIFPGTTILIDTYDVVECIKIIIEMVNSGEITKPNMVRIDSEPLEGYIEEVGNILKDNNVDIGIFISGDMTPQRLKELKDYKASMAGTKYVYFNDILSKINCGFVYKIVQYEQNINDKKQVFYPEKKATGKKNYTGLKNCKYDINNNKLFISGHTNYFGLNHINKINQDTEIVFNFSAVSDVFINKESRI